MKLQKKLGDMLKKKEESNFPVDTSKESCPHPFTIYTKYDALTKENFRILNKMVERSKEHGALKKRNVELVELLKEANDYLKGNKLNYIGNGSILHTKFKQLIKNNEND